ncbi:MAG: leucyl/phenylalanyl-tRNA--protein transferase, partial [Treponema sp.]|nr:leucyl/phenylalanyl-tRNA--protein transferase [Treponema sp.]
MKNRIGSGPDPKFPHLTEFDRYTFPNPENCPGDIIAIGGNLSPGMLLSAYEQGIFPWYSPEDPILWQSPDPRFVLFPEKLRISQSMKKILKKGIFTVKLDQDFEGVISACSAIERPGQKGTWITGDIIRAYCQLHSLGFAHSAESYLEGELAGGCYGIRLGRIFFGESMFTKKSNASKAAFLTLAATLFADDLAFIDCQVQTGHLESLGGEEISRNDYLAILRGNLGYRDDRMDRRGNWGA